jgi:DNA-binding NtrC family response regulator
VRELRNVVQRAAIMSDGALIDEVRLPEDPNAAVAAPPQTAHGPGVWVPVGSSIADVERKLIMATLESCGGVRERTAEILGISLKTLYNRLREYGQSAEATSVASSVSSSLPSSVSTVLPTATQPAS